MIKSDLVRFIAEEAGITQKSAALALNAVVKTVRADLTDSGRSALVDLGTFRVVSRKARKGVNPRTGESIEIPEKRTVTFKVCPGLKDAVK